jgi:hypothetical protein
VAAVLQVFEEPTRCGDVVDWGLIDDLEIIYNGFTSEIFSGRGN